MMRAWAANLIIVGLGLTLFAAQYLRSGRIDANDGLGWDGRQYAHMVTGRIQDGNVATQARPLVPLLTRIPHAAGLDVIAAFQLMNFVAAAALYLFLCLIFDRYGVLPVYKAYFIATVALSIATSRIFAFYPTLVDLGALAVITGGTSVLLTRSGWTAGAAALLAVTAREFGAALAIFGFVREVRQGRGVARALLTYAPAVAALLLIRWWASTTNLGDRARPRLTTADLVANLALWRDPWFAAFFLYFALTLLGGITMLLVLRPIWTARTLARAPELAAFAALIVAAAAVGNADIWRYLVFLLPVLAVLFALYVRDHRPGLLLLGAALLLTLITQQPLVHMDMTRYFTEWFPGYVHRTADATEAFWSAWHGRFIVTALGVTLVAFVQRVRRPPLAPAGAGRAAPSSH